jgi:hypothetical protein
MEQSHGKAASRTQELSIISIMQRLNYICSLLDEISTLLETPPSIASTPKQCLLYLLGAYYLPLPVLLP